MTYQLNYLFAKLHTIETFLVKFNITISMYNFTFLLFSTDEIATDHILKGIQVFASVCGQLDRTTNRDSFISCICKSALPVNYYANNLASLIQQHQAATSTPHTNVPLSKTLSTDSATKEAKEEIANGHSIVVRYFYFFI